jgi:hypothetical protein
MSADADHLEGFEDLLDISGRVFALGTEQFRGIVRTIEPDTEEFDLTPTDDDSVILSALRSEIPNTALKVGVSLLDSDGYRYRVTRLRRSPNQLITRLECVVLNP